MPDSLILKEAQLRLVTEDSPDRIEVDRFILEHIDSVPHLEALLLLWQGDLVHGTAEAVAKRLWIDAGHARSILQDLPTGLGRLVTKDMAIQAIDNRIAEETTPDAAQRRYTATMETMMAFDDQGLRNGEWRIILTEPDKPFVIGDAPVVTWERTDQNVIVYGQGFAKPNVETFLPVFPTACLHVLPAVPRNRRVRTPTTEELNAAQAAFATQHCFTNIRSVAIDELLQPKFGIVRLGIEGFSINHLDHAAKLFEILMNQPPYRGRIDEGGT